MGARPATSIQKTLAQWVKDGNFAPGRIRDELMAEGRIADALKIDRGYVGTIHALGQRLLTKHAFAAERSPGSRLLTEPERDRLVRLKMDGCKALAPLMADLKRCGDK